MAGGAAPSFGRRVRQLRESRGLSRDELSDLVSLAARYIQPPPPGKAVASLRTISRWETDEARPRYPDVQIRLLAQVFAREGIDPRAKRFVELTSRESERYGMLVAELTRLCGRPAVAGVPPGAAAAVDDRRTTARPVDGAEGSDGSQTDCRRVQNTAAMSDPTGHPSALISWAHVDPGWDESQVAARQDDVLRLSAALRQAGVDAELDLHHLSDSVDWTRWGPAKAAESDFVLVVPSQRWRTSWEGGGDPTKGAGSAAEADVLRSLYSRNRDEFLGKVRLVMLPGSTDAHIPDGLHGVPRFRVSTFDDAGIEELVRSLTAQAKFPKAPLGALPVLPPSAPSVSPADERAALQAALDALPVPTSQDRPELPWYRERQLTESRLHRLDETPPAPAGDTGLGYGPLPGPVSIEWKTEFAPSRSSRATLTVHVLPVPSRPLPARQLAAVAGALPARVRGSGLLDPGPALDVTDFPQGVIAVLAPATGYGSERLPPAMQGVRVAITGQVSAWTTLPADSMGTLIDQASLHSAVQNCLGLIDAVGVPNDTSLAIAVELGPVLMVNIGPASAVGRSSATMNAGFGSGPEDLRVEPDEAVHASALTANRAEAATTLADLTLRAWRQHWPT